MIGLAAADMINVCHGLAVRLLHANMKPAFNIDDGVIIFQVDEVVDHEIAVVEWA